MKRALFIIFLGAAVYMSALGGDFIWDDVRLVEGDAAIRDMRNIPAFFAQPTGVHYRPIQKLSYAIDHQVWALNPLGYHITNIFLHICMALAVYWLIALIFKDGFVGALAAALFAVSPIHTEAVSYISGRADILAGLFAVLSAAFYLKHLRMGRPAAYAAAVSFFALALISKESAFIMPLVFLLCHYVCKKTPSLKEALPVAGITLVYAALRLTILRTQAPYITAPSTVFDRIPGFFAALAGYARMMALPLGLHMEYGNRLFAFTDIRVLCGAALFIAAAAIAFKKRRTSPLIFFGVSWFGITLLPHSNLYPIDAYMAEHWLYLPSVGFFLILAGGLKALRDERGSRGMAMASIAALVSLYSVLTFRQNDYWREPITFYERTLEYAPKSARMYNNLGSLYARKGRLEEALASYKKALELDPKYTNVHNNLAALYARTGKSAEAIALYRKVIEGEPKNAGAYSNLASVYADAGMTEEAIGLYKKALMIDPDSVTAHNNIGGIYMKTGREKEGLEHFKKAIEIDPDIAAVYMNLARAYSALGRDEEAMAVVNRAQELIRGKKGR